jgi:hypothetical protein
VFLQLIVGQADAIAGVGRQTHAVDRDRYRQEAERRQKHQGQ